MTNVEWRMKNEEPHRAFLILNSSFDIRHSSSFVRIEKAPRFRGALSVVQLFEETITDRATGAFPS